MKSWQRVWKKLTEPQASDPDEARREYMTRVIVAMTGATLLGFTLIIVAGWIIGAILVEDVIRMLLLSVPVGVGWWLAVRGHWRWSCYILPGVFYLQGLYSTYTFGLSTPLLYSVIALLLTAILLGVKAQWVMVVLALGGYLIAGWLYGDRAWDFLIPQALVVGGSLTGIALLLWFSTNQLEQALTQARSNAAELKKYRSHLEDLVTERSAELVQANEQLRKGIAERKQAQEELTQKAQDLARSHAFITALNRVTAGVESTRDPKQVLTTLGDELQALGLTCVVALREPDSQTMAVHYSSIEATALALAEKLVGLKLYGYPIPKDTALSKEVVEHRRAVYASDPLVVTTTLFPRIPETVLRRAIKLVGLTADTPAIYLPLTVEERVVGALAVWGGDLKEDDVEPLSISAGQVASAFENARLFQAEQRRTRELSALLEAVWAISSQLDLEASLTLIAEQMVKAAGVDGCTLSRWDRETDAVVVWIEWRRDQAEVDEPGTVYDLKDFPCTRAVLETRQPHTVHVSDPEADPAEVAHMSQVGTTNLLMLPLAVGERVVGVVGLDESKGEREFTAAEIRLCQALANQTAVAIENSRLYESVRQELAERQRAEEALQRAYDELELRVQERTVELARTNATLWAENSERRRAERALRESRERYKQLVEHAPAGIYEIDMMEGTFSSVNDVMCEYTGYTREELLSLQPLDLLTEESQGRFLERYARVAAGEPVPETVEYQIRCKDGHEFWAILNTRFSFDGERTKATVVVHDISERKRAEQLLQALNRAALAMEKALTHDEIFISLAEEFRELGFDFMVLRVDEEQSRLTYGYGSYETRSIRAAEALTGLSRKEFSFPIESVDVYQKVVWDRMTVLIEGDDVMRQMLPRPLKRLAGQLVKMLGLSKSIAAPVIVEDLVVGVLSVHSEGLTERDVPAITAFAHQVAAAWRKAQLIGDLERSLEDLKRAQSQLVQAQKLEAVGRLAGGIAHDFNNLLTVIQVSTQLAMRQLHPEDPLWGQVNQIQEAGDRAAKLTEQLLKFSRSESIEPFPVDLNRVATDLNQMLQRIIGEDIELVTTFADDLWPVKADPSQLEQVIVNLAVNARDAMPKGGRLSIETANVVLDKEAAAHHVDAQPGEYVALTVSDTGIGMDEEVQAHIFEPFFTTKGQGGGTGLGLATVYGIVRQNAGYVWVYSEVEQGTTFKIYLPRAEDAPVLRDATLPGIPADATEGSETILVVEDELAVQELVVHILRSQGYQVMAAGNGVEALQIDTEYPGPIHLLLTDVITPEMNGLELAEQLQSRRPDIRVLYMSGYSDSVIAYDRLADEGIDFLSKPFTLESLSQKVRAVLDAPKQAETVLD